MAGKKEPKKENKREKKQAEKEAAKKTTKKSESVSKKSESVSKKSSTSTSKQVKGNESKNKKIEKEIVAPKKPMSPFFYFLNEEKNRIKDDTLSHQDKIKMMSNRWTELKEEEKKPYNDKSKEAKAQYDKDMVKY